VCGGVGADTRWWGFGNCLETGKIEIELGTGDWKLELDAAELLLVGVRLEVGVRKR
jgi:hypothetical protein